jgi:predicted transcriptional regulator
MSDQNQMLIHAAEITAAWLGNPNTRAGPDEVPAFLSRIFEAVSGLDRPGAEPPTPEPEQQEHTPAVSVRKSLASPDHIISMIDGKPYKSLKRHLSTNGLTPDQYRQRYGLKPDYPMVAPGYSEARRAVAKQIGLGRKPARNAAPAEAEVQLAPQQPAPKRRKRPASAA